MKIAIGILGALVLAGWRFPSPLDARDRYVRPAHTFSNWGVQP